ncbi:MAG: 3'-5' exonuclease [Anaerostipes sp.]|nr:3'-5' exonuclease [Anaerostipes sp.]
MNDYVAFDLETTGLSMENDQIIEIGGVKISNSKIIGKFNCIIYPEIPVSDFIIELTGISRKQLEQGIPLEDGVRKFLEFSEGYPVLGHNVMFDYRFMKRSASHFGLGFEKDGLDTLAIAKKKLRHLENKKLGTICEHYQYVNQAAHRAYDDALATAVVFERMKMEFSEEKELFIPKQLQFKVKKEQPITAKQKRYLNELIKYHKIKDNDNIDQLTQSQASKKIDGIILEYGVIKR